MAQVHYERFKRAFEERGDVAFSEDVLKGVIEYVESLPVVAFHLGEVPSSSNAGAVSSVPKKKEKKNG